MSDTDRTRLAFCKETTFATPNHSGAWRFLRMVNEALSHDKKTQVSAELRGDRQVPDLVKVGVGMSGPINFELSRNEYDAFLLAAIGQEAWTDVDESCTCTVIAGTTQKIITTGAGFAGVPAGGYVMVSGLADAGNNGIKRILSKSADNNSMVFAPGSFTNTNATPAANVEFTTTDARNGLKKPSFTLERQVFGDDDVINYQAYLGCKVSDFNLSLNSQAIITGSVGFMGRTGLPGYDPQFTTSWTRAGDVLTVGATDPTDGDVIVLGTRTYTLKTALSGAADEILLDGSPNAMAIHIRDAIAANTAGFGIDHSAVYENDLVYVGNTTADATVEIFARALGTLGNTIAKTTTAVSGALSFANGTALLIGGADGTLPAVPTIGPVMNSSSNVGTLFSGFATASERFQTIGLKINSNARPKDSIGDEGAFEIGVGRLEITGTLDAYFRNNVLYRSLVRHEYTSLSFTVTDPLGQVLAVTLPYIALGKGDPFATGINADVMLKTDFQAIRHPVLNTTIIINKFL